MVGRGGELETGSRSDPKAAVSGTGLWLREGGAFCAPMGFQAIPKKSCVCSEKRYTPEGQGALPFLCCPRG